MRYIKKFENNEETEENEYKAEGYRKLYDSIASDIKYGCEDGIEKFFDRVNIDRYEFDNQDWNGPKFGKYALHSMDVGRNGFIDNFPEHINTYKRYMSDKLKKE